MKKFTLFDECFFNRSSKTPIKIQRISRNRSNKNSNNFEFPENPNFKTLYKKKSVFSKSILEWDSKASTTSRSNVFNSNVLKQTISQRKTNNTYKILMDSILRKNNTLNLRSEEDIFHENRGKSEFKKRFNEIRNSISIRKSSMFNENLSLGISQIGNKRFDTISFMNGSLRKLINIKQNIDEMFPKRQKTFYSKLKSKIGAEQKQKQDSNIIPIEMYNNIKKNLNNNSIREAFIGPVNKIKIQKMKEKLKKSMK